MAFLNKSMPLSIMPKTLFQKVDCFILLNFHDHWKNPLINKYLPGEASEHYEGMLLVSKNKKPLWVSHPFNYKQAKKEFSAHAQVATYNTKKELTKLLKKNCGLRVGFDSSFTSVASLKSLHKMLKGKKLVDVSEELGKSREVKEKNEVKNLLTAVRATRNALEKAKKALKKGMSEKDLAELITNWLKEEGYKTAFCIVAFKENTSHIHHAPTSTKKLSFGMPVLIDCGAKHNGYIADLTETFWFGPKEGKAYKEFESARKKVEECLFAVEKMLLPGTKIEVLWKKTASLGKMPHALGHGIGVETHDHPKGLGDKTKWALKEGMVLAIEPALYINRKFGVRIEKDYLITARGKREL